MDEMKIKLSTKFMKEIISKMLSKVLYKKYGYKIDVCIDNLDASIIDGNASIKLNAEVKLDNNEFTKLVKMLSGGVDDVDEQGFKALKSTLKLSDLYGRFTQEEAEMMDEMNRKLDKLLEKVNEGKA